MRQTVTVLQCTKHLENALEIRLKVETEGVPKFLRHAAFFKSSSCLQPAPVRVMASITVCQSMHLKLISSVQPAASGRLLSPFTPF
jgi:hypothetical protein